MNAPNGRAATPDPLAGTDPTPRAGWDAAAAAVLRKSGKLADSDPDSAAWDRLAGRTIDGLVIPPLGTPSLTAGLPHTGFPGTAPYTRGSGPAAGAGWDIRAALADPDPTAAARALLTDLENGATSVLLTVGAGGTALGDLPVVLREVLLDLAAVVLDPFDVTELEAAQALCAILPADPAAGTSLGVDPLGRALRSGALRDQSEIDGIIKDVAALATAHGVGALVSDATAAHDAGAGEVGELAWSLAVGAHYLRVLTAAGIDIDLASRLIGFRYAATDQQFTTIAKLRAARLLWHRVTELSGASAAARRQYQHALTSRPMTTRYEPWVNLLRSTVAAFAAGVGGAQAITVLPFDSALGVPDELGRRMARNISSLLISESHVAAVADPAGGAHAVEALTAALAEAAWEEFGTIEAGGGAIAALADGSARHRFDAVAERRRSLVARRRFPITGVTEFPQAGEELPVRRPHPARSPVTAWAGEFEAMRDSPAARPAYLATPGPVAAHTARAGFAMNLLTAGGIAVVPSGPASTPAELVDGFDPAVTSVAVLAGADTAYTAQGPELVAALREAGATTVLLAGRVPAQLAGRVDGNVTLGDDVLEFLRRTREALSASGVPS